MQAKATVLLILFSCAVLSRAEWEDLGDQIGRMIEESIEPLKNLGERISKEVDGGLSNLANLRESIEKEVEESLEPLKILGDRIGEEVEEGLEPLRILESIINVKQGVGGTTVATFNKTGQQFIIRDGKYFECTGKISESGSCSGELVKFEFKENKDFCYASNNIARINDWICIRTNPTGTTGWANGKIICESPDNSPKLMMKYSEYQKLCEDVVSVQYKYFANNKLEHVGNGLKCTGTNPQVCTYSESTEGNSGTVSFGSSVFISN